MVIWNGSTRHYKMPCSWPSFIQTRLINNTLYGFTRSITYLIIRSTPMTILVTGATGFLGSALVTELVRQQQPVRILARDEQKARAQFGDAVTIIAADINDEEQVRPAVDGASIIYHLVGRLYGPRTPPEPY